MRRLALLSFDLEEFDAPLDHGQPLPLDEQIRVSADGLAALLPLLDRLNIRATFFTTACFAEQKSELVRIVAAKHEIASHGYYHGRLNDGDLAASKSALEQITGRKVVGFRRARMADTDAAAIVAAGYGYDSSENPTWIPGRYNNFFKHRTPYVADTLIHIPASATPLIRFPLFWLAFKATPLWWFRIASCWCLAADGHASLYFHPWEFADLSSYNLPRHVKRPDGGTLLARLESYLRWLSFRADFMTYRDFADNKFPTGNSAGIR